MPPPDHPRRIVYICDWLPPDYGAVGQYAELFAREFARAGHDVVLAGLTTGDERVEKDPSGLTIIRLHADAYDKGNTMKRIGWTLRTNIKLIRRLWKHLRWSDEILFTGSPPLFLHMIAPVNILLGKQLTYRITDFHPECAMAERTVQPLWLKTLYRLTLFWRRRVTTFEALGDDQIQRLIDIGIDRRRIRLKPDPSPVAIPLSTRPLPRPSGTEGKVLLLYSGNWGVAHDTATFVEAYRRHHTTGSRRLVLWLNAVGSAVDKVASAIETHQLPIVRGKPVPLEQLASLLITPDASLITLSDAFVGFVLPSKVHGCIEAGKPILYIGSPASDVHKLCTTKMTVHYARVDVGDVEGCLAAIESICDSVMMRQAS